MNVYKLLIKRKTKEGNNRKINSSLICTTPDLVESHSFCFFSSWQTLQMEKNCPSLFLLHYSELRFHNSGMKRLFSSCFASSLPYFLIAARSLEKSRSQILASEEWDSKQQREKLWKKNRMKGR